MKNYNSILITMFLLIWHIYPWYIYRFFARYFMNTRYAHTYIHINICNNYILYVTCIHIYSFNFPFVQFSALTYSFNFPHWHIRSIFRIDIFVQFSCRSLFLTFTFPFVQFSIRSFFHSFIFPQCHIRSIFRKPPLSRHVAGPTDARHQYE